MAAEALSGRIEGGVHVYPVRVYFEDTDAGGVVYHTSYLRFAERARTEMMRLLGVSHASLIAGDGVVFAVRRCEVDFLRPAHLDDLLEVRTRLVDVQGASLWAEQIVDRDGDAIVAAKLRLACVRRDGRPARFPARLRRAFVVADGSSPNPASPISDTKKAKPA
ncbi:MAG: tol-pal system-associated acyl-CoA thioesterase [Alphaproteobacteria bacterium]|nr:tol-pal system-associated acyl-CoA thioesterase [Alphaproteobacteria bacterium]